MTRAEAEAEEGIRDCMMRCTTLLESRRRGCPTRNEVSGLGSHCFVWAQRRVGLGMAAEDRSGESRDRRGSFCCEAVVLG
jgi:hypothetical protein